MTYQPAPQPGGPMTEASVPGLKYSDIVAAQSNPAPAIGPASPWSREQLATAAQAATLPFSPNSPITTPGTGVSSSSGAAETAIGNLGNSINGLTTKPPAPLGPDTTSLTAASAEAQKILKDQQTALEQRRKQAIIDIENSFNQTQASTEQAQKSETGQTGIGLARVGGFDSLSGQGVLTNLAATQRAEISTLQQKRQAAINQAQAAYDDKSFDLAFKLASEVKGLDADIYKRTADYNSALNDAAKEARLQATSNFNMQQALKKDAQDSRDFAYSHGINKSIYQIGNQYYDTATGQQVDPSKITDTNQVQTIDPNSKASADYVANLASKYADTVFPTMTPEQAQKAMQYSKIYKEQIRPPQSVTNPTDKNAFKFAANDRGQLLSANFTNDEITQIESDLQKYSIDQVSKGMTADQQKVLKSVVGGATYIQQQKDTTSKLTRQNLSSLFNIPDNSDKGNILGFEHGQTNAEKLNALEANVKKYRDVGYTDAEILKLMQ